MSAFPRELFLFCQLFGALSLRYSKNPKTGPSVEFSKAQYLKNLVLISLLTMLSYTSLWVDYEGYLSGQPIRMVNSPNVLAVILDVASLNFIVLTVFDSNTRRYNRLINMCDILERLDYSLCMKLNKGTTKVKVVLMFLFTTAMIANTEMNLVAETGLKGLWHLVDLLSYYLQGALYLQFTFFTQSFTMRFRTINKMIEREVNRQKNDGIHKLLHPPGVYLSDDRLKLLLHSYSRLCEAVQEANAFYSCQLFATVASSFVHNIITLYFLIQEVLAGQSSSVLSEMVWVITHIGHLVLLVRPCTELQETASETAPIVSRLLSIDLQDTVLRQQLETFLLQLLHYDVGFFALGFFEIDSHILTSIGSSVTTYLMILIQFQSTGG